MEEKFGFLKFQQNRKTALEIAHERQHIEFAALLARPTEAPAGAAETVLAIRGMVAYRVGKRGKFTPDVEAKVSHRRDAHHKYADDSSESKSG